MFCLFTRLYDRLKPKSVGLFRILERRCCVMHSDQTVIRPGTSLPSLLSPLDVGLQQINNEIRETILIFENTFPFSVPVH